MQTLWSRIATLRSGCRCPQCIPSISGTTRRAGATATRRAPKYLTSSTLLYSGIFAAAATFDAGLKQQRRDKWDAAIAEVRCELGEETEHVGVGKDEEGLEVYEPFGGGVSGEGRGRVEVEEEEVDVFADVRSTGGRPRWPMNTGSPLKPWNLAPESIYATDRRRAMKDGKGWSPKKIETISLCVDMLQLRIFLELQDRGFAEEAAQAVPEDYGDIILDPGRMEKTLRSLEDDYYHVVVASKELENYSRRTPLTASLTRFAHSPSDLTSTFSIPNNLNASLQHLFHQHKKALISTPALLARLCHNISTSPSPPSLDTFNTLLLGLAACKEHTIMDLTISTLRQCHLRPNETTLATILDFYTTTSNAPAFAHWVQLMRGKFSGLALARSDIRITAASEGRLVPKDGNEGKIIQLPYPTPKVFASLIKGVVKFSGFEAALRICRNMGEEGWGLCMGGIGLLLRDCADRGDWTLGLGVWQQIRALDAKAKRRARGERDGSTRERIPVGVFADMIRLCLRVRERAMYDEVWALATRECGFRPERLRGFVRWPGLGRKRLTSEERGNVGEEYEWSGSAGEEYRGGAEFDNGAVGDRAESRFASDLSVDNSANATSSIPHTCSDRPPYLDQASTTTTAFHRARRNTPDPPQQELTMEHLHGSLAGHYELDEYEARERPMNIDG